MFFYDEFFILVNNSKSTAEMFLYFRISVRWPPLKCMSSNVYIWKFTYGSSRKKRGSSREQRWRHKRLFIRKPLATVFVESKANVYFCLGVIFFVYRVNTIKLIFSLNTSLEERSGVVSKHFCFPSIPRVASGINRDRPQESRANYKIILHSARRSDGNSISPVKCNLKRRWFEMQANTHSSYYWFNGSL